MLGPLDHENPTPHAPSRPSSARDGSEQQWELLAMEAEEEDVFLKGLAGVEPLEDATSLQLVVNTCSSSIHHLGAKLPRLTELNLTGSVLPSLRDLGTGFRALQVLWVSRCGLTGLDGIVALPALRELYAAFNDISDLQPLDSCTELEVLDLEGNCVTDLDSVLYLGACSQLQSLTLAGNPVAEATGYRQQLCSALGGLQTLDDQDVTEADRQRGSSAGQAAAGNGDGSSGPTDAAAELSIVCQGIKHARVGVDSHEFHEVEMLAIMAMQGGAPQSGISDSLCIATSAGLGFAGLGGRPSTGAAGMPTLPLSAGTWMQALRSSQAGSALRASLGQQGPPAGLDTSSSAGPSPACSRPGSSSGPNGRPASALGAGPRPFSARLGTASLGAGPGRPGTGASAPPTAGGLYWSKHRLHGPSAAAGMATDSLLDSVAAGGSEDGEAQGSSALTYGGGGVIGGSLAKDLRRRRKGMTVGGQGAGGPGAQQVSASVGDLPQRPGGLMRAGSTGPFGSGVSTSYDTAALLEELRRWKCETADKALMPEEGPSHGTWAGAGTGASIERAGSGRSSLGMGEGMGAAGEGVPGAGGADILDLAAERPGTGGVSSLSDDLPQTGAPGLPPPHPGAPALLQHAGLRPASGNPATRGSAGAGASSSAAAAAGPGQHYQLSDLAPVHGPTPVMNGRRGVGSQKMTLAKVVRDISEPPSASIPLSLLQPSGGAGASKAGSLGSPVAARHRPPSGSASPSLQRSRSSSTTATAGGRAVPASSPIVQRSPSKGSRGAASPAMAGSYEEGLSTKGRPGSGQSKNGEAGGRPGSRDSAGSGASSVGYQVSSVAGEVDLAAANPRPVFRHDPRDDMSSDDEELDELGDL